VRVEPRQPGLERGRARRRIALAQRAQRIGEARAQALVLGGEAREVAA
jgi:hypothetical protein